MHTPVLQIFQLGIWHLATLAAPFQLVTLNWSLSSLFLSEGTVWMHAHPSSYFLSHRWALHGSHALISAPLKLLICWVQACTSEQRLQERSMPEAVFLLNIQILAVISKLCYSTEFRKEQNSQKSS